MVGWPCCFRLNDSLTWLGHVIEKKNCLIQSQGMAKKRKRLGSHQALQWHGSNKLNPLIRFHLPMVVSLLSGSSCEKVLLAFRSLRDTAELSYSWCFFCFLEKSVCLGIVTKNQTVHMQTGAKK